MPTTITKTVKSSGGDYSSLSAWEAGEQGDLVTADEIRQAECYAFQDTAQCTVDGWTTDATRYPRIMAAAGAEAQMPYNTDGTAYRLELGGLGNIDILVPFVRVERIQIKSTVDNKYGIHLQAGAGGAIIDGCLVQGNGAAGSTSFGIRGILTSGTATIRNTVVYGYTSASNTRGIAQLTAGGTFLLQNVTAYGNYRNIVHGGGTVTAINCLAAASGLADSDFVGTFTDSGYNASSDATAPGANSRQSQTFTFVNAAGGDYHLASGDGGAKDFGTDLSATFTVDFDGDTRPTGAETWDIGADEVVAAGGTTLTVADATLGLTADSPALVQANLLAAQDAALGLTAEAPVLTQANILTAQDAALALTSDAPTLTQSVLLAVADAALALAGDSPALTQSNILAVADALVSLAAESPALVQAHLLSVADALLALTADPVMLASGSLLEPADAVMGLTAESPALTQAHVLAVADAVLSLVADSPVLSQAHVLVVADGLLTLVVDGVVLQVLPDTFVAILRALGPRYTVTRTLAPRYGLTRDLRPRYDVEH